MSIAGFSLWVIIAIAGIACLLMARSMIKSKHTVGATIVFLGGLAFVGLLYTNLRSGEAARAPVHDLPPWLSGEFVPTHLPPIPSPGAIFHGYTEDGLTTVVVEGEESGVLHAVQSAQASAKRALERVSRTPLAQRVRSKPVSHLLTGVAIAALLCVGYVFLDAGTRGHFTWRLRITALVAFAAIWVAVASLQGTL